MMRQERIDLAEDGVDYNVLKHSPPIEVGTDPDAAPTFVNPNLDVVYSEAWIALDADTPAVLEIPQVPEGRCYTAQIVDEWAEITHNINERNFPEPPVRALRHLLGRELAADPQGCVRVDIPSAKAKLLTRVQIGDDIDGAVALQLQFQLSSAGTPQVAPPPQIPDFDNAHLRAWAFDAGRLAAALAPADACGKAAQLQPLVRQISAWLAKPRSVDAGE